MSEARYMHSTLYHFGEQARIAVIRHFHEKMNDIAARVWYNTTKDIFVLECPGGDDHRDMGANADETLSLSIQIYIDEELEATQREERTPRIERFAGSIIDDVEVDFDGTHDVPASAQMTFSSLQSSPARKNSALHLIHTELKDPTLRLFHLADLPPGMMRRVLVDVDDMKAKRLINIGTTVRVARGEDRTFNGHIGAPVSSQDAVNEQILLDPVTFPRLSGTAVLQGDVDRPPVTLWKFKDGQEVSIKQWQMGIGEVEYFEETEERAEVPKDTLKLLATEDPALGRARVVKGAQMLPADDVSESEAEDAELPRTTFSQLCHSQHDGDSESENSDSASDSSKREASIDRKRNFTSLLARPSVATKVPSLNSVTVTGTPPTVVRPGDSRGHEAVAINDGSTSHTEDDRQDSGVVHEQDFKSHGQPWANVDSVGLKANATSQARWKLEHPEPQKTTKRITRLIPTSRISTVNATEDSTSASVSVSSGCEPEMARKPRSHALSATQASVREVSCGLPAEEKADWESIVVPHSVAEGRLIDDFAPVSRSSTAKYPPGLPPTRTAVVRQALESSQRCRNTQIEGILIDVPNEVAAATKSSASARSHKRMHRHRALVPQDNDASGYAAPASVPFANDDAGEIVERLGKEPVGPDKKYTMSQKVQKKDKGEHNVPLNGSRKIKAQLELPDPIPLPKKRTPASANKKTSTAPVKAKAVEKTQPSASVPNYEPAQEPVTTPPTTRLVEMINSARAARPNMKVEVTCELGLLLSTFNNQPTNRKVPLFDNLLNGISTQVFLPRLTTSTSDAIHILGTASQGTLSTRGHYELLLKDLSGTMKWLICDGDLTAVTERSAEPFTTAYMHYPYRVWDAKWTVNATPATADLNVVGKFIASMHTIDEAPSFSARMPSTFNVEQVLAVSEYSVVTQEGVRVVVTESRALKLESRQAKGESDPNLKAIQSGTRDELIAGGRLWWQARVEAGECESIEKMGEVVDRLMCEMDGVGYGNVGPWDGADVHEAPAVPEIPYW
ncbi:hypothetical protein LTR78_004528 [Recurvomyces mirabilis]|uniref:Uncharacterized protein n=1 Tax=Recurvomyces mirabilis TaxID=574656 RepID=A0AAE1C2C0_9PEZI|nr:hypothetical protein LTR78_004528 [Recurvomyces mirabilis]KAK5152978.1 hypothetical protein LTS14_008086 [Recurvomyces mirabilis]